MSEMAETKTCPLCAETIRAAAKLCPFCQTRQTGVRLPWVDVIVSLAPGVIVTVGVLLLCLPLSRFDLAKGRKFGPYRADLEIVQPSLQNDAGNFSLSGYVTNKGQYPWRVHEFEVRFRDSHGELVDAYQTKVQDAFVVQPRSQGAFNIRLGRLLTTNDVTLDRVRVKTATDGNRHAEPDSD